MVGTRTYGKLATRVRVYFLFQASVIHAQGISPVSSKTSYCCQESVCLATDALLLSVLQPAAAVDERTK